MEWARGRNVILLKVSVFNQVIFISFFAVRLHSFGLQRQVREKERRVKQSGEQLVVGELFRNFLLACKVQKIINEDDSLKGEVNLLFFFFPVLGYV